MYSIQSYTSKDPIPDIIKTYIFIYFVFIFIIH